MIIIMSVVGASKTNPPASTQPPVVEVTGSLGLGDGSGKSGLAVIHVANRADVHVGLVTFEFFFCHDFLCSSYSCDDVFFDARGHFLVVLKLH